MFDYPIEAMKDDVQAILTAAIAEIGIDAPHLFGKHATDDHQAAPRYVWIPTRTRERNETPVRMTEEIRAIAAVREHCFIECWGETYRQACALRNNVLVAIHRSVRADGRVENGEWVPNEINHYGFCYRLEVSMGTPIVDAFVNLTTLADPQQSTATIGGFEGSINVAPDTEHDGDSFVQVLLADDP